MEKSWVKFIILLLGFFYILLSCAAVPSTRSLKSNMEFSSASASASASAVQDLLSQDAMKLVEADELFGGGVSNEERKLMESTDYPGTGANKNHDPKPPGRA